MLDPGITRELVTASGNQIEMPALNDTSNVGVRLAENTAATSEGDLVFTQKLLDAYKYSSGPILVSSELLQDSALPFEQIVRDAMAERIARKVRSEEHTSELQSLMRISYAVFCLKKKKINSNRIYTSTSGSEQT